MFCNPLFCICINNRKLKLLFRGIEIDKKVINLVQDILDPCIGPVNLVDNKDWCEVKFKGLFQDKSRLR